MSRRVFSELPVPPAGTVEIAAAEAHHLLHVLRVRPGDAVTLFDGRGGEFHGEVLVAGRKTVEVQVGERLDIERELPFDLVLAAPLPKGDRARWLVEKAVEVGVTRLVPLVTERAETGAAKGVEKLGRYVIEASKQCGRNQLMEIAQPLDWRHWLASGPPASRGGVAAPSDAESAADVSSAAPPAAQSLPSGERTRSLRRWVAHPGGRSLAEAAVPAPAFTFVAAGPEGGFTEPEVAAAIEAGWDVVDLGPRILRIETAAIALATAAALLGPGGSKNG